MTLEDTLAALLDARLAPHPRSPREPLLPRGAFFHFDPTEIRTPV